MRELIDGRGAQLRELPDDVLRALYGESQKALAQLAATGSLAQRVFDSYRAFHDDVRAYHGISEQAYINARARMRDEPYRGGQEVSDRDGSDGS